MKTKAGTSRPIDEVAPEELRNAMVYLTTRGMSIDEEELFRETADVFGTSRLTANIRQRLEAVLSMGIAQGVLRREGDRITPGST